MDIRRCDVYIADLRKISTDCGIRPVVIVQNDKGNTHSNSYIVALITSKKKKPLPTHFVIQSKCGLRKNSTVMCERLMTVDREMLKEYVGTFINTSDEAELDKALSASLQI